MAEILHLLVPAELGSLLLLGTIVIKLTRGYDAIIYEQKSIREHLTFIEMHLERCSGFKAIKSEEPPK